MRNWRQLGCAVLGLVVAQLAHAQTEDQEYRIINNMTADSGSVVGDDGATVSCAPAEAKVHHRCYTGSHVANTAIGGGFSRNCPNDSILFWPSGSSASDGLAQSWTCAETDSDLHITITGTISACGRGTISFTTSCIRAWWM